jgi:haloalkane dehalogenase
VGDGRLHYVDEGTGPLVVLVHGTPTWSFEWRHVIAALRHTHRVVALDHLGFGRSDRPHDAAYTPEAHALRFARFMQQVVGDHAVTLVVHDFGGPIAFDWALDHAAQLTRVVVVNSFLWSFADDAGMLRRARMVHGALGKWLYRRLNASLRLIMPSAWGNKRLLSRDVHARYQAVFPDADSRERVLYALALSLIDSAPFFERLRARARALAAVPMTVLWGLADSAFEPHQLAKWRALFPHAQVTTFDGVGHWPHEEAPAAFVAALSAALSADAFPVHTAEHPTE